MHKKWLPQLDKIKFAVEAFNCSLWPKHEVRNGSALTEDITPGNNNT